MGPRKPFETQRRAGGPPGRLPSSREGTGQPSGAARKPKRVPWAVTCLLDGLWCHVSLGEAPGRSTPSGYPQARPRGAGYRQGAGGGFPRPERVLGNAASFRPGPGRGRLRAIPSRTGGLLTCAGPCGLLAISGLSESRGRFLSRQGRFPRGGAGKRSKTFGNRGIAPGYCFMKLFCHIQRALLPGRAYSARLNPSGRRNRQP
jgi:hypothetical protein